MSSKCTEFAEISSLLNHHSKTYCTDKVYLEQKQAKKSLLNKYIKLTCIA